MRHLTLAEALVIAEAVNQMFGVAAGETGEVAMAEWLSTRLPENR